MQADRPQLAPRAGQSAPLCVLCVQLLLLVAISTNVGGSVKRRTLTISVCSLLLSVSTGPGSWIYPLVVQGLHFELVLPPIPQFPRILGRGSSFFFRLGGEERESMRYTVLSGKNPSLASSFGLEGLIAPVPGRLGFQSLVSEPRTQLQTMPSTQGRAFLGI